MTEVKKTGILANLISNLIKLPQKTIEETVICCPQSNNDDYGWLEPNGTFHKVPWGNHQDFALETIKRRNWFGDFIAYKGDSFACFGDFLSAARGWVLLHNPSGGVAIVTRDNSKRLTRAQSDFLYGYYADRERLDLAKQYLE